MSKSMKKNKDGTQHKRWVDSKGRPREASKRLDQQEFMAVEFHLQGFNKTESMTKAGYSDSYAKDQQHAFFKRTIIIRALDERRWAMKSRNNKMVDRIQDELAKIAFFNIGHFIEIGDDGELWFDYSEATMDELAAVGEITIETFTEGRGEDAVQCKRIKCKPYDKKAALDSLARIHGMFQDNLNVTDAGSLEARLARGRARVNKQLNAPDVIDLIDGDYEEVEED